MTPEYPVTLQIQNMSCAACAGRVLRSLQALPGVTNVQVNLASETAQLHLRDRQDAALIVTTLEEEGYPTRVEELEIAVENMNCAACVSRVEKALATVPGVTKATVNPVTEHAMISVVPGLTKSEEVLRALGDAGYPGQLLSKQREKEQAQKHAELHQQRDTMLKALALTLPVFVLEMGAHLSPGWHHFLMKNLGQTGNWALQFALTTAVLFWPGRAFFRLGFRALARRAPDMNTLVALGAGAAWSYSTVAFFLPTLLPSGARVVYFEAAAVIVTLILLGRWLEGRAKGQASAAIEQLVSLQPQTALVKRGEGWEEIAIEDLQLGDAILIHPGTRVPTDAAVIAGYSRVDESMITGEPMPVSKTFGAALTGGTVNGLGSLTARVTRTGDKTTLARIVHMVQQAQAGRLPIQALVDRVTLWFVPLVLGIAALTILAWLTFGTLSYALVAGVSVLIIACPCAMGLATPTSIMVGTGRAAQLGVLFRQGDALQSLSTVDAVAFDKTGTLTLGAPQMNRLRVVGSHEPDTLLALLASVESRSEHPLAQAVVKAARDKGLPLVEPERFQTLPGQGVIAELEGRKIAIGNDALMSDLNVDIDAVIEDLGYLSAEGKGLFFAAIDGQLAALVAVKDPIRPEAANAIRALKRQGLRVAMITGDGQGTAQIIATALGIDYLVADTKPEDKVAALKTLAQRWGKVAFVGDGINDAPVLAEADVGIAVGTGTDIAIETADIVLMSGGIAGVRNALAVSTNTLRNIKQNLFWAFGYNTLLIPVAAGMFFPVYGLLLSPALAAGAMACSSLFVVLNALRLRRMKGVA
ncbi:MAG: heavy metal translocating P-type ATPase [Pseudomonadota bacterium]